MGCILYELAFFRKAFRGDMAVFSYAASHEPIEIPENVVLTFPDLEERCHNIPVQSRVLELVVNSTLDINPRRRPKAANLCAVFCAAYDWERTNVSPSAMELRSILAGGKGVFLVT